MNRFIIFLFCALSIFHFVIAPDFGLTWDVPHHIKVGELTLGINNRYPFISLPYGVVTDVIPVLIAETLPSYLKPTSYLYLPIFLGILGGFFFYLLLFRYYGHFIAIFSTLILFSIPRFIGHMHTNTKDVGGGAFFMGTVYFLTLYFENWKKKYAVLAILFFSLGVNTKLTIYQLFPLFLIMSLPFFKKKGGNILILFLILFILPSAIWFFLWPHNLFPLSPSLEYLQQLIFSYKEKDLIYSLVQFWETTPFILLILSFSGIGVSLYDFRKRGRILSLFFPLLFLYTIFKYPLFGFPIVDDIRYFIDVYFATAFLSVFGVYFFLKKYAVVFIILIIGIGLYRSIELHPYEIAYANFLSKNNDRDFWAASYKEVFADINQTVPKNSTVSVRLAPELAYFYIRPDLRKNLNRRNPNESDFVVILNRPSFFMIFRVENFYQRNTPTNIFQTKTRVPLSYFYDLRVVR